MQIGADLIKVYVKITREPNFDGDRLLKVIIDKKRMKNYSFMVNARKVKDGR